MPNLGVTELLIIGAIAMLIFGPKQLPKLGRSVGETIKAFRGAGKELTGEADKDDDDVAKS